MAPSKTQQHTTIAAALANPEEDVSLPNRRKSTSFNAQVAELSPGEVATKAQLIDKTMTVADVAANLTELRQTLRNNMTKVVQRAREATGGEYSLEVIDTLTPTGRWFLVGLITRLA